MSHRHSVGTKTSIIFLVRFAHASSVLSHRQILDKLRKGLTFLADMANMLSVSKQPISNDLAYTYEAVNAATALWGIVGSVTSGSSQSA